MTERTVLAALVSAVNTTAVLPCTAYLDWLGDTAPAASVQQLPGERWQTRYINGSGIHETPFAVLYRTAGADTSGRLDAASALWALAEALEALGEVSGLGSISGADTPSLTERDDHGQETWRASFILTSQVDT